MNVCGKPLITEPFNCASFKHRCSDTYFVIYEKLLQDDKDKYTEKIKTVHRTKN